MELNEAIAGTTEIRVTRRKRHADGWKVWVKYPWQEQGRNHVVALLENGKPYCETCTSYCIGYIAVSDILSGRSTITAEEETE